MHPVHWLMVTLFCAFIENTGAYERVYLTSLIDSTGSCSHESSLEYGFTVGWDPNNNFENGEFGFRPGWVFHCIISFKPRKSLDGLATRTSLSFRDSFLFADFGLSTTRRSMQDCGNAWIRLYSTEDYLQNRAPIWTHCSLGTLPGLGSQYVFDDPNIDELTLEFFIDFNIQVIRPNVAENLTTTTVITTPNPRDYPRIHFHADFTSYVHGDACVNATENDYFRCTDSRRCLAKTDVCDVASGMNCRSNDFLHDISDQASGFPSYCGDDKKQDKNWAEKASLMNTFILLISLTACVELLILEIL